eukprot:TRINITY_DN39404_c0_g1_i1.p1 TRINITY_DN39404_c0_g1~~TRINITY_DN39404_c0_g1_i1.p1  ORF type:complete len:108 (-),score=10.35 TRINITY_DN39404_c0_g1_i1:125-448(-)
MVHDYDPIQASDYASPHPCLTTVMTWGTMGDTSFPSVMMLGQTKFNPMYCAEYIVGREGEEMNQPWNGLYQQDVTEYFKGSSGYYSGNRTGGEGVIVTQLTTNTVFD